MAHHALVRPPARPRGRRDRSLADRPAPNVPPHAVWLGEAVSLGLTHGGENVFVRGAGQWFDRYDLAVDIGPALGYRQRQNQELGVFIRNFPPPQTLTPC
jgi:hypothetical protein